MNQESYHIFLVEDNEMYLKTLELFLKEHLKFKVQIHTFYTGEDCMKNLRLKPKIIILDYFLNSKNPNAMDGLEVLKRIKAHSPEINVVMLSAQDNVQVATDIMKYGAFDYVPKSENAFLRVQNALNNVNKLISQTAEINAFKKGKTVMIVVIIVVTIFAALLQIFCPQMMQS